MAAPNDPSLARVRICTTENGTYVNIGYVRSADIARGSDGDTTLKWLGGEAVRAGDRTFTASIPIYWDDGDTNGQEVALAAWGDGSDVWIQVCPKGTSVGAKVLQIRGKITEAPLSFAADADAVEGGFSFRGEPSTLTTVTLA